MKYKTTDKHRLLNTNRKTKTKPKNTTVRTGHMCACIIVHHCHTAQNSSDNLQC